MPFLDLTEDQSIQCKTFVSSLISEGNINNDFLQYLQLPCFLTTNEIEGEVVDVLHKYFRSRFCPTFLTPSLIHHAVKRFMAEQPFSGVLDNRDKAFHLSALLESTLVQLMSDIQSHNITIQLHTCRRNFLVSDYSVKNTRRKMEDRHVAYQDLNTLFHLDEATTNQSMFAIFDGHGGVDAANYAASQLICKLKSSLSLHSSPGEALRDAILQTDADFSLKCQDQTYLKCGTTAAVVVIQGNNLTVGWLGDSQIVLCKAGQAVQLMEPHVPNSELERKRIESLGGCVMYFDGWRVNGQLGVSRAIGDYHQKPFITAEPDVEEYEMEGDEEFLILACDGLWDVVEPLIAVQMVRDCIQDGSRDVAAKKLVEIAIENKSTDNISVLVVFFEI